jgi:hypothetical protein
LATSCAGARRDALLEQADLAREIGVLALEVGERLLGVASGTGRRLRSPSGSRTKTVPVSSTRPHGCCSESVTASPCRGRMPPWAALTASSLLHRQGGAGRLTGCVNPVIGHGTAARRRAAVGRAGVVTRDFSWSSRS